MPNIIPILNARPTNPTQEEFLKMQKFGLQPYDRSPNDYLRFVAKIFTAWRDPNDNILNFDPFDDKFGVDTGTSLTMQATADKSIIAYVDGFQASYHFVRLTTDENSTDLTKADNIIVPVGDTSLITYVDENGNTITIDKAKYGEYHRFLIQPGICFIDNQLIQIVQETEWWFRLPTVRDYNPDGTPNYELGQFIIDPLNVYSLLPGKNYKLILSYEYINQFESNSARLRFETDETAVDEPYILIASFTTDEFGYVHQTEPVNEKSFEKFKHYIVKEKINPSTKLKENYYYLKDINPQYLDKKYMSNHKNLFKHLQSQLLTTLSESKISNTFHCKEITEEIDPSVSSGDFIYYDGFTKRWYPAEVSRQDFDRVVGLYLKNASEGTNFVFTSGIIEVDDKYTIIDSENLILRNLIPGAEYFLAEDTDTVSNKMPFIDIFKIDDRRSDNYFSISTTITAKASSMELEMIATPGSSLAPFSRKRTFELDPTLGEQKISQSIFWQFTPEELKDLPILRLDGVGPIMTDKITFKVKFNMIESSIIEKNKEIIEDFKLYDNGDIFIDYIQDEGLPSEQKYNIKIEESHLYLSTNGLPNTILTKGPGGSPVMKLLEVMGTTAKQPYPELGLNIGDRFVPDVDSVYNLDDIEIELTSITNNLKNIVYNSSPLNFGLNEIMAILGSEVSKIEKTVSNLNEAIGILEDNFKAARLEFQATESVYQQKINDTGSEYRIVKDTYDSLVSQRFVLIQKRNAAQVEIDRISTEISALNSAKIAFGGANIDLNNLITTTIGIITNLENELHLIESDLLTLDSNIVSYGNNVKTLLMQADVDRRKSFNHNLAYYAVPSSVSIIDFTNKNMILQRSLYNLNYINTLTLRSETEKSNMLAAEIVYNDEVELYTTNIINGVYNFAQQLLASNQVIAKKEIFDRYKAMYDGTMATLIDQQLIRDNQIKPMFDLAKSSIRGELFVKVTLNTDPNSIWGNANLTEFKIKISKPLLFDTFYDFIYKEDTKEVMRLTILAGETEAFNTIYLQALPDTYVDSGLPRWTVSDASGKIVDNILNLNKYNQKLIDDHILLTANASLKGEPEIFTLDQSAFAINPVTISKPIQVASKIRPVIELDNLFTLSENIKAQQILRETSIVSRDIRRKEKTAKESEIMFKKAYKDSLDQQLALGVNIVNEYDIEILHLTDLRSFFKTSPENIDVNILGTNLSYDAANIKINLIDSQLISYGNDLTVKQAAYQAALDDLKAATDIALGEYITGISETNELISLKEKTKNRIIVMYDLYKERTNLVISIYNNLNSILSSGIFNNEWIDTDEFLLKKFQYELALEKQLIEIVSDVSLIPLTSIIIPKTLEYIISPNGLSYPMDLQQWVFVKTSGKISTKNYPGATSVGIALNENTLILNIKHNKCGDISEFLNVYGNENDFIAQLEAKYHSSKNATLKLDLLNANIQLQKNINQLTNKVSKGQVLINRNSNGKNITVLTSLTTEEMDLLDFLVGGLISGSNGLTADTEISMLNKEYLIRAIYAKFFGTGEWYNPQEYLFGDVYSKSSIFSLPGNPKLLGSKDPFNSDKTSGTLVDFNNYVKSLSTSIKADTLLLSLKENLFKNKVGLYKDLDIINYILAILSEPLINYNVNQTTLTQHYTSILQSQLIIKRFNLKDHPNKITDDFEDPSKSDDYTQNPARILAVKNEFDTLTAAESAKKASYEALVEQNKLEHKLVTDKIIKYDFYKTYYQGLKEDILTAIRFFEDKLKYSKELKIFIDAKIRELDKDYLIYYNRLNKLPNIMWDIFRINNYQRIKWNYTYLALRIIGMQKELNNQIVNNLIQYSPINAELSALKIKKNAALVAKEVAQAHAYDIQIKAIEQKKTNFYNMLQNFVTEFNTIQQKYAKPTITPETELTPNYLVDELYMQNPDEYNLSYAFAPYPAYKELV